MTQKSSFRNTDEFYCLKVCETTLWTFVFTSCFRDARRQKSSYGNGFAFRCFFFFLSFSLIYTILQPEGAITQVECPIVAVDSSHFVPIMSPPFLLAEKRLDGGGITSPQIGKVYICDDEQDRRRVVHTNHSPHFQFCRRPAQNGAKPK